MAKQTSDSPTSGATQSGATSEPIPTTTSELSRRSRLERARDHLSTAIETCESMRDLPSLIREYRAVLEEIESIPDRAEVSAADEIAKRRAARRAGSSTPTRASGSR